MNAYSQYVNNIGIIKLWNEPSNFKPSWIFRTPLAYLTRSWTISVIYVSSPYLKPFVIRNLSDKLLPNQNILYVSGWHIVISLTSFTGIRTSMKKRYKTSRLNKSYAFLKYLKSWHTASSYSFSYKYLTNAEYMYDQWVTCCVEIHIEDPQ
jgi:hypothetical protein